MNFLQPLWPHQEAALNEAIKIYEEGHLRADCQMGYGLFFEPRCGKTPTSINILRYICNAEKRKRRTLIFCPPRVVPGWKAEFLRHSKFEQDKIILLQGAGSRRLRVFRDATQAGAYIFITNYETLLMEDLYREFEKWKPEFLVADESHRVKNPKAKQSKLLEKLANPRELVGQEKLIRNAPFKLILSGSPILNGLMDLYWQFRILDGGTTFSYYDYQTKRMEPLSFTGFKMTYFTDRNQGMLKSKESAARYFPKWELKTMQKDGFDGMRAITEKIKARSMRVERAHVLELPPNDKVTIEVDMTTEQKKLYSEMKRDFITWYKSEPVVARMALTKSLRLLQITSGFVKTDEGVERYLDENPKQNALQELLTDLLPSGKCLVWSVFRENYRQIRSVCEALGVAYAEVHGDISPKQQEKNILAFKEDPTVRVFIGHPDSGGEGINLVEAPYNIFYSRSYSLKHSIQASARNQSQDSQHEKTVRYDLVARGTIDQVAAETLLAKEGLAQEVYSEIILKSLLAT